jgi:hypothetical protein
MNRETSPDGARRECNGRSTMARPILVTTEDEREFQVATDQYKIRSGRQFPTWSEILEVLRSLGYDKRIWRPVGAWSPLASTAIGAGPGGEEPGGMVGWFARTETSVMP